MNKYTFIFIKGDTKKEKDFQAYTFGNALDKAYKYMFWNGFEEIKNCC